MAEVKRCKEDKILNDIERITGILESVKLENYTTREKIFNLVCKKNFFESELGIVFLKSLLKNDLYNKAETKTAVLKDLKDLKRIVLYLKENKSEKIVEKFKTYRFTTAWIQEFATNYLNENSKKKTSSKVNSDEAMDLKKIYALLEKQTDKNEPKFDSIYEQMKKSGGIEQFKTWLGYTFFTEIENRTKKAKKKKRKEKWFGILGRVCVIVAFFLILFGIHLKEQARVDRFLAQLVQEEQEEENQKENEKQKEKSSEKKENSSMLKQYEKMYKQNNDMVGWLTIEDTNVNYPVLQNIEDDSYYLTHNFLKEDSIDGGLFVDGETKLSPLDKNIVIYGHNMKSGTMFGQLKNYKDYNYFANHQTFSFDTLYQKQTYQIVAVFVIDVASEENEDFCYYEYRGGNQEEFEQLKLFLNENRLYDTGNELVVEDETVMLSTCEETSESSRLVVVGRKIK